MTPANHQNSAPDHWVGAGLKPAHYRDVLSPKDGAQGAGGSAFDFFEVHAENYMCDGGAPHAWLGAIAERHPLSFHGVCLSVGGLDPLDKDHLQRLKVLNDRYQPALISEHIAWSAHDGVHFHDLLAPPLSRESLTRTARNIMEIQDGLSRQILIENPSHYLSQSAEMTEPEYLNMLAASTGCSILLDINNIFVSARNLGFDPEKYLDEINPKAVGEIHLAGHSTDRASKYEFLIDDHGSAPCDEVGALYQYFVRKHGSRPTLIEWDTEPPALARLETEVSRIRQWRDGAAALECDRQDLEAVRG